MAFEFATLDSVFMLQVATLVVVIILLWRMSKIGAKPEKSDKK